MSLFPFVSPLTLNKQPTSVDRTLVVIIVNTTVLFARPRLYAPGMCCVLAIDPGCFGRLFCVARRSLAFTR